MFQSRSRRPVRLRTVIARFTLTATVALAVGIGVANAQQTQPQPQGQQPQLAPQQQSLPQAPPGQGVVGGSSVTTQTTVAQVPTIVPSAAFADPRASQILGVPESHCGHVIDLLIRNRVRQQTGAVGAELAPGLLLSRPPSSNSFGDLELINVQLVTDGGPESGR